MCRVVLSTGCCLESQFDYARFQAREESDSSLTCCAAAPAHPDPVCGPRLQRHQPARACHGPPLLFSRALNRALQHALHLHTHVRRWWQGNATFLIPFRPLADFQLTKTTLPSPDMIIMPVTQVNPRGVLILAIIYRWELCRIITRRRLPSAVVSSGK